MAAKAGGRGDELVCPSCRGVTQLRSAGDVASLVTNFDLMHLARTHK